MIRLGSIFGVLLGLAILFAAFMGSQQASVADTQPAALDAGCVAEKVALDEGYGVTRTETRIVCNETAAKQVNADDK
jgi:hypothetical protein